MQDKDDIQQWIIKTKYDINVGKNIIKDIKDDELKELWEDIKVYEQSGSLQSDSKLYKLREYIRKITGDVDFDMNYSTVIIPTIMEEIAKLHYNER